MFNIKTKILLSISLVLFIFFLALAFVNETSEGAVLFLTPSALFGLWAFFSIQDQKQKHSLKQKNVDLARMILNLAIQRNKILSVYEIMAKIKADESEIRSQLEIFQREGIAEMFISKEGQELYRFKILIEDDEKKDILTD